MKKTITVDKGQNLFDVALSHYGDAADGLLQLWKDNPAIDLLSGELLPGQEFVIDTEKVILQTAVDEYNKNGLINTGSDIPAGLEETEEGIFDFTFDFTFE